MHILERMNKVYTKNGDRINKSTDWVHYFYQPSNKWSGSQDLRNFPASYWEDIRQLSYKYYNEDDYKKEHTLSIRKKKILAVQKKKIHF